LLLCNQFSYFFFKLKFLEFYSIFMGVIFYVSNYDACSVYAINLQNPITIHRIQRQKLSADWKKALFHLLKFATLWMEKQAKRRDLFRIIHEP